MLRWIGALTVFMVLVLTACGSGDGGNGERLLRLSDGDITEAEFLDELRAIFVGEPASSRVFCASIQGLSTEEATDATLDAKAASGTPPMQPSNRDDDLYAMALIQAECKRIEGG